MGYRFLCWYNIGYIYIRAEKREQMRRETCGSEGHETSVGITTTDVALSEAQLTVVIMADLG